MTRPATPPLTPKQPPPLFRPPPRLAALAARQRREGHLGPEAIAELARELGVPAYELYGLASFFPHFRLAPPARPDVRVCGDLSCALGGSAALLEAGEAIARRAGLKDCRPAACACLGRCDAAPAVEVDGRVHTGVTPASLQRLLEAWRAGRPRRAARPAGIVSPRRIFPYRRAGDAFLTLKALRRRNDPEGAIAALAESGLRGMGGAGFPAGRKWGIVRAAPGEAKFLVCNADESEPGTFKDRALMDTFPALVVEGMLIAAWAAGARQVIVYVRREYGRQARALRRAARAARAAGLAGGSKGPEIAFFTSPGGYICGEETALLEVLEDRRAQPRDKPPFPGEAGLFGRPTLVHNVETLALAVAILRKGPDWFRAFGRGGARGFKLVGVSGPVRRPGVHEVELGTPVRALIEETAGGLRGGLRLGAFSPGGASSGFLPAAMAGIPYDFGPLAEAGSMLGSGALVAIPEGADMAALAHGVLRFFRDESCGKCVPCRLGTEKLAAFLGRLRAGEAAPGEAAALEEVCTAMADTSICGLGQAAPIPYLTLFKYFRENIKEKLKPGPGQGGAGQKTRKGARNGR